MVRRVGHYQLGQDSIKYVHVLRKSNRAILQNHLVAKLLRKAGVESTSQLKNVTKWPIFPHLFPKFTRKLIFSAYPFISVSLKGTPQISYFQWYLYCHGSTVNFDCIPYFGPKYLHFFPHQSAVYTHAVYYTIEVINSEYIDASLRFLFVCVKGKQRWLAPLGMWVDEKCVRWKVTVSVTKCEPFVWIKGRFHWHV